MINISYMFMYVYRAIFNFSSSSKASNTYVVLQHSLPAVDKFLTSFVSLSYTLSTQCGTETERGGRSTQKERKTKGNGDKGKTTAKFA